jgi:hypothetical protein
MEDAFGYILRKLSYGHIADGKIEVQFWLHRDNGGMLSIYIMRYVK